MLFPGIEMNFFSITTPSFSSADAKSELVIDPKSLSPSPVLEVILTSNPVSLFASFCASSINFCSLKARCFKFSASTFFALGVAKTATPCGIKKFLP